MTSNDKQIDLLMRRYAQAAPRVPATGHLDADELSAFAEGSLPAATRARYMSHLADCDDCRKQASAVAISSGAVVRNEQTVTETKEHRSFWQAIAGLFALPILRYAAFGAVALIVAGIAFVALRRPTQTHISELVAKNDQATQEVPTAIKPSAPSSGDAGKLENQTNKTTSSASPLPGVSSPLSDLKRPEVGASESTASAPPLAAKDAPPPPAPVIAEKKSQGEITQKAPSYAPVPPGEPAATQQKQEAYREQQAGAGISGPRQQQQKVDLLDKAGQDRDREVAKETGRADDNARKMGSLSNQAQTASRRGAEEKAKGPMRNMENNTLNRNESANRAEPPKTVNKAEADERANTEDSETRSAGGRKFRRQGNAWVDQKFKSSMALKSVSRGSEEFDSLDSGLRSIAQQLNGVVIVVWKGKAYQIK